MHNCIKQAWSSTYHWGASYFLIWILLSSLKFACSICSNDFIRTYLFRYQVTFSRHTDFLTITNNVRYVLPVITKIRTTTVCLTTVFSDWANNSPSSGTANLYYFNHHLIKETVKGIWISLLPRVVNPLCQAMKVTCWCIWSFLMTINKLSCIPFLDKDSLSVLCKHCTD